MYQGGCRPPASKVQRYWKDYAFHENKGGGGVISKMLDKGMRNFKDFIFILAAQSDCISPWKRGEYLVENQINLGSRNAHDHFNIPWVK